MKSKTALFALALAFPACSSSSSSPATPTADSGTPPTADAGTDASATDPCTGSAGPCKVFAAGTAESDIANALGTAVAGSTFVFGEGTFAFTNTLTFTAKNVTVTGAGMDKTIFDFKGLASGSSGTGVDVLDGSDGFTIKNLAVRDTFKNGIKVKGSTGVTFQGVKVSWTNPDPKTHGDYALYPVFCKKVLVEGCDISGSSDAGIYVGQSQTIIVRNNVSHDNVAGIEIENSYDADVYKNTARNNTGGLLVFDLPGSGNQHDGHNVHVHDNIVDSNNTANFNATGSTVAQVPAGTGTFVLGTRDVEIDHNTYSNNFTAPFSVVSYFIVAPTWTSSQDPAYNPVSKRVHFHDNTLTNNGTQPDLQTQLGLLLVSGKSAGAYPHGHVPDMLVDGIPDSGGAVTGAPAGNPTYVCLQNNGTADFANMHFDQLKSDGSNFTSILTFDATAYNCALPAQAAISF
jgi:parallel beta-helix repeat protein